MAHTTIKAVDLKVGDTFARMGSTKRYTVTAITPAHRSEYVLSIFAKSEQTGKETGIVWPNNGMDAVVVVYS